jgi:histidine triad (HIT) family protein
MSECIFCSIVAGEIPGTRIYEDDAVLAFLDVGPIVKGHTLVIPKEHYESLEDIPQELLCRCMDVVKRVAAVQRRVLGSDGVNLHQANGKAAGQVVPHIHFHVIPRYCDDGHHWNWNGGSYDSSDEMNETGALLRDGMEQI